MADKERAHVFGIKLVVGETLRVPGTDTLVCGCDTVVSEFRKGDIFATNPEIQELVKSGRLPVDRKVGHIVFKIHRGRKLIEMHQYYPLLHCEELLEGKGIATFLEHKLERYLEKNLAKKYPGLSIVDSKPQLEPRIRQLRKRGRNPEDALPLSEAIKKSGDYVAKEWRKRRVLPK